MIPVPAHVKLFIEVKQVGKYKFDRFQNSCINTQHRSKGIRQLNITCLELDLREVGWPVSATLLVTFEFVFDESGKIYSRSIYHRKMVS